MMNLRKAFATPLVALLSFGLWSGPVTAQSGELRGPALLQVPENRQQIQMSFSPVVKTAAPAVVNVYSRRVVRSQGAMSPFDFFFGGRFSAPRERVEQSLGSGVIVSADGVIVTNNHVISGAQELKVVLSDRREFDAELLVADERTDLAVLQIAATDLPSLNYARSTDMEVGDLVLAIGNPFGVGQSVTSGIVSALARTDVGITDYSFFIQTDAAVNPGNSGGALVNMNGDLVGVNTAIFSRSGQSSGIGFAIPVEMVQRVVEGARDGGRVIRPWLGARVQPVTSQLASSMGLSRPQGALVNQVYADGPADRAGLRVGDIITGVDGSAVNDEAGVRFLLATRRIGDSAPVTVLRDGREVSLTMTAAAPPETPARDERRLTGRNPFDGALIANLSPALADELGLDPLENGVIVLDVARGSNADYLGLRPGDRLLRVGEENVASSSDVATVLERNDGARTWPMSVRRGEQVFNRTIQM